MNRGYKIAAMRQLRDQQVRFAPRERKLAQADNAEKLLTELEPDKTYTYEYLCFRITDYRPDTEENCQMTGKTAAHDIRLLVEDLFDAANVRVDEMPEPVHTVEDLSSLFNVSTKTISRWRQQGLVSRRFLVGRPQAGWLSQSQRGAIRQ